MLKSYAQAILLAVAMLFGAAFTSIPTTQAQEVKVPATVDDHLALAKMYEEKATSYRKEAEYHHQMFEAYKKSVATSPKTPNPWVTKMQKHCQMLAKDAEKMAKDADSAAEYHRLRAKELQGK